MANFIEAIFHLEKRELKRYGKEADRVMALEPEMMALTDDELRARTKKFQDYLAAAETEEEKDRRTAEIKIEAFAVCREGAKRALGQTPYKVKKKTATPRVTSRRSSRCALGESEPFLRNGRTMSCTMHPAALKMRVSSVETSSITISRAKSPNMPTGSNLPIITGIICWR